MDILHIFAILITLTAVFSYLNHRFIGLPVTIGVMLIALLTSLLLQLVSSLGFDIEQPAALLLQSIDFNKTVLQGMLSFLLFAGALHVNINDLSAQKGSIALLATVGTLTSTFLIGASTWFVLHWFGIGLSFLSCLLFGALISPTDPIAVLGILKKAGAPKSLETTIVGESLFNDGVGIVVFLALLNIATGSHEADAASIGLLFVQEAMGGAVCGLVVGYATYFMLKSVDSYQVEVLLTLALVMGGYALAGALHLSGPIAMVVAGLLIGNHGRTLAMSDQTREHLDVFWELVDEILNAVLFVLIGLEVLVLTFTQEYLLASLIIIPLGLLSRFIAIAVPVSLLRLVRTSRPGAIRIMTWGGLRGGISVALALSMPMGPEREVLLAITYAVVIFSILVQGLTIGPLIQRTMRKHGEREA